MLEIMYFQLGGFRAKRSGILSLNFFDRLDNVFGRKDGWVDFELLVWQKGIVTVHRRRLAKTLEFQTGVKRGLLNG